MNRHDFGNILEELGFTWQHYVTKDKIIKSNIYHKTPGEHYLVAVIDETRTNEVMFTDYEPDISSNNLNKFYKSLTSYIATPLENRDYPKTYRIRLKDSSNIKRPYLNYSRDLKKCF